jgi:chemotaxis protein MotA
MEGGALMVLYQPAELLIIGGAAGGSLLIGTPVTVVKAMVGQLGGLLGGGLTKEDFADLLGLLFKVFRTAQQSGIMALETHFDKPAASPILKAHPKFLARHDSVSFLADSIKVIIVGGISPHDLADLMAEDLEVHHEEAKAPAGTLSKVADALPGLGIVAAVLGIVITMGAIDGPPSVLGHKVGAALVGTFLGILLSYGFIQPLASALELRVHEDGKYEQCIKAGVLATYKGLPPAIAIEFSRRVLPHNVRPTFEETEKICRNSRDGAGAKAA